MQSNWIDLPDDKPIWIAPLGDIQWNGHEEDIAYDDLGAYVERAMSLGAWFIGMGDYIDMASPSGRMKVDAANVYDNLRQNIDDRALELTHQVAAILKPTRGRWLGMLAGHHFWQFKHGSTSDQRLCESLDAKFLGDDIGEMGGACVNITFPTQRGSHSFKFWAHHGSGSGEESSMLLKLKKIAADHEYVDLFLMGHMTKMVGTVIPKIRYTFYKAIGGGRDYSFKVIERRVPLVGTGGWSKGLLVGRSTYVEKKPSTMRPVSLGAPLIQVIPEFRRSHNNTEDVIRWAPRVEVTLS